MHPSILARLRTAAQTSQTSQPSDCDPTPAEPPVQPPVQPPAEPPVHTVPLTQEDLELEVPLTREDLELEVLWAQVDALRAEGELLRARTRESLERAQAAREVQAQTAGLLPVLAEALTRYLEAVGLAGGAEAEAEAETEAE